MLSIRKRLLIAAFILLTVFVSFAGWVLDRAFVESIENGASEQLKLHIYSLLTAAEEISGQLFLPEVLQDPRFNELSSGLYGAVYDAELNRIWQSNSALGGLDLPALQAAQGKQHFGIQLNRGEPSLYHVVYGVTWESISGSENHYNFVIYEDANHFSVVIDAFRQSLWFWLGGLVLVLLITLYTVLYWGLLPLQQVSTALDDIKSGKSEFLRGRYPKELSGLVHSLNLLIDNERLQRERYKNSLGDLAHSLKTPLAVVRGSLDTEENLGSIKAIVTEQTQRMNEIVSYQLKRAAAATQTNLGQKTQVDTVVNQLTSALAKVYRDKAIDFECDLQPSHLFWGDESNLFEMLGNVLDNAAKHCKHRVFVASKLNENEYLQFIIEDDGVGIDESMRQSVLNRGVRADTTIAGQGIGLSVVRDIVESYRGSIALDQSGKGGLLVDIRLPLPEAYFSKS